MSEVETVAGSLFAVVLVFLVGPRLGARQCGACSCGLGLLRRDRRACLPWRAPVYGGEAAASRAHCRAVSDAAASSVDANLRYECLARDSVSAILCLALGPISYGHSHGRACLLRSARSRVWMGRRCGGSHRRIMGRGVHLRSAIPQRSFRCGLVCARPARCPRWDDVCCVDLSVALSTFSSRPADDRNEYCPHGTHSKFLDGGTHDIHVPGFSAT